MAFPNKRRWLIFIILFVVVINLIYYGFMRLKLKDNLIQKYVVEQLEKATGGNVEIADLKFSDKYLMVEGFELELPQSRFSIKTSSIHAQYDLSRFLWNQIRNQPFAEDIYINDPVIGYRYEINYDKKDKDKNKKKTVKPPIPLLNKYFRKVNIANGTVNFSIDVGAFKLQEDFYQLNGSMITDNGIHASIAGVTSSNSPMQADVDLSGGWFNSLIAQVNDYVPQSMYITQIDTMAALYDINFSIIPGNMLLNAGLKDIYLEVADRQIMADSLYLNGDSSVIDFVFTSPVVDGNDVELSGKLLHTFSSRIGIDAQLTGKNVSIEPFQPIAQGKADVQAHMTGRFSDFLIEAHAVSDSLQLLNQNLRNIDANAEIGSHSLKFVLNHVSWEGNSLQADGDLGYDMSIFAQGNGDSLRYQLGNIALSGNLEAAYSNTADNGSYLNINDFCISTPYATIDDLKLNTVYNQSQLSISMHRTFNDISLTGDFDLENMDYSAELQLHRLHLSQLLNEFTLPNITGGIKFTGNKDSLLAVSDLRFYDRHFGSFDGTVFSQAFVDLNNQVSFLKLNTRNAKYNHQPVKINLTAQGNLDSIQTSRFEINDQINIDAAIYLSPKFSYKAKLNASDLQLTDVLRYAIDHRSLEDYQGHLDIDIMADSRQQGKFIGTIIADSLKTSGMENLGLQLELQGNNDKIDITSASLTQNMIDLGFLQGSFSLEKGIDLEVDLPSFDLSTILPQSDFAGIGYCNAGFCYQQGNTCFDLEFAGTDFDFNGIKIDQITLDLSQLQNKINIRNLQVQQDEDNFLQAKGSLGYNVLTSRTYQDTSQMYINFSGDLLDILQHNVDYIIDGKSKCELETTFAMGENGFDISNAQFSLQGSSLHLKNQLENFKNINIDFGIKDNVLSIRDFQITIGDGRLLIENSVGYNDKDIYLHRLNTGQILLYTSDNGIRFYLPDYTIPGSYSRLQIEGRDSHYMRLYKEQNQVLVLGDLIISGTDIIYPPKTDNLMQIINSLTADITQNWTFKKEEKTEIVKDEYEEDYDALPFDLNIDLKTGENVRYVTYPFEISFSPDSYANIRYHDDKFSLEDANFISEEGRIELVGTEMEVDDIEFIYNEQINEVGIAATFNKKTADGTLIQLRISTTDEGGFPENLKMELISDNPDDKTDTEKIFRLRYGRGLDDITATERKNLFEDDLIQTAGGEIENMIIDPVINQFELYVSRFLNIDYFQMETSFIYNLLSSNSDLYGDQEDAQRRYSSDFLLENLSLKAGKYLLDDLFLNYQITFQKVYETELDTKMGVYHTISFRYDMPLDIKFIYEYNIDPYEKDSHQYSFSRSFRFKDIADLWKKAVYPSRW